MIDGDARVVGLHQPCTAWRPAIELNDVRNAPDAVADESRENPPFALGPGPEVAGARLEETLRVAPTLTGHHRFAEHRDVLARRHLQAAATKDLLDLLRRHRFTCTGLEGRAAWDQALPSYLRPASRSLPGQAP